MSEIKFRAWVKSENKMYLDIEPFNIKYGDEAFENYGWAAKNSSFEAMKKDDYVLMRFAGTQDRNGIDIYESDIILTPKGIATVTFELGCFYAATVSQYRLFGWNKDCIEVIGNIYQPK